MTKRLFAKCVNAIDVTQTMTLTELQVFVFHYDHDE